MNINQLVFEAGKMGFDPTEAKAATLLSSLVLLLLHFGAALKGGNPKNFKQVAEEEGSDGGEKEKPKFNAWERVYANQFESIPMQMIVIWGAVLNADGGASYLAYMVYAYLFLRVSYYFLYIGQIQPWRSGCFALSMVISISIGVVGIVEAK